MIYDHHRKAGNQGDCVKHPALIAALDNVMGTNGTKLFHYLDIFAGHAWHPLPDGDEYEWKNGIGKLTSAKLPDDAPDSVKCWWRVWHDAPAWPTSTPAGYPGSSWIAADRCRRAKRPMMLELYDSSEEARRDIERAFQAAHAIQDDSPDICLIGQSLDPTEQKQEHIKQADFVFIDPPGWQAPDQPSYPNWKDILDHVLTPRSGDEKRPTLMWMPGGGQGRTKNKRDSNKENPGAYPWDENSTGDQRDRCDQVKRIGYSWTAVRWRTFSKNSGCILVYNCADDDIRKAIDSVAKMANWGRGTTQFEAVKHSELPQESNPMEPT